MGDKSGKQKNEKLLKDLEQLRKQVTGLETENLRLKGEIEENRRSTERYRLICRDTDDLIAVTTFNLNPTYTYISPSHKKMMGYEPEELLGKPGFKYIHPKDRLFMIPLLKGYFKNKLKGLIKRKPADIHEHLEYRAKAKDGTWHHLQSTINVINDELLFISRDLTAQRKVEEEKQDLEDRLRQSEKMEAIGTLAGGVAHDLNNILSGVVNYPELLLMDIPPDSSQREPLQAILNAGQRAAAIVNDLLALARRGTISMEPVQINTVITGQLNSPEYKKLLSTNPGIRLTPLLEENAGNIMGSAVHLDKMIMNLLSNAVEASPNGGEIEISTRSELLEKAGKGYDRDIPPGEYVVLSVTDNGIGMSPEDLDKIFMPFFSKKKMGRSGTGLGMTVVWGTIADHNGFIVVHSEINKGTTFEFYFPETLKQIEKQEDTEMPPLAQFSGSGQTIMVIDDLQEQRDIASLLLTQLNYTVLTAESLDDAFDQLNGKCPDLFLLDMIMDNHPDGKDGLDNYKEIISRFPKAKAIITSGYSETDRVKKALKLGVGAYIQKPYGLPEIANAIKKEIDG